MQVSVTVGLEVSRYWIEAVYQVLRNEMCVLEGSWQDGCETKQNPVCVEINSNIFSDHNTVRLDVNYRKNKTTIKNTYKKQTEFLRFLDFRGSLFIHILKLTEVKFTSSEAFSFLVHNSMNFDKHITMDSPPQSHTVPSPPLPSPSSPLQSLETSLFPVPAVLSFLESHINIVTEYTQT